MWMDLPEAATTMAYWADLRRRIPDRRRELRPWRCTPHRPRGLCLALSLPGPRTMGLRLWSALKKGAFQIYLRLLHGAGPLISRVERELAWEYYLYFALARREIRARLEEELIRAARCGQAVAILAHSMGSVIAYDAVRHNPCLPVDLLITMGSPLGFAAVQQDLCGAVPPPYPPNLRRWLNVFDGLDPVTMPDQRLAEDFTLNGARLITDRMVRANHGPRGERDPHHWFGYLTSPEVGDAVSQFWLAPGRPSGRIGRAILGSPSASCCGRGDAACAAPSPLSDGFAPG